MKRKRRQLRKIWRTSDRLLRYISLWWLGRFNSNLQWKVPYPEGFSITKMVNFCLGIIEIQMWENCIVLVLVKYLIKYTLACCASALATWHPIMCLNSLLWLALIVRVKMSWRMVWGGDIDSHGSSVWNYWRIASDRIKPTTHTLKIE